MADILPNDVSINLAFDCLPTRRVRRVTRTVCAQIRTGVIPKPFPGVLPLFQVDEVVVSLSVHIPVVPVVVPVALTWVLALAVHHQVALPRVLALCKSPSQERRGAFGYASHHREALPRMLPLLQLRERVHFFYLAFARVLPLLKVRVLVTLFFSSSSYSSSPPRMLPLLQVLAVSLTGMLSFCHPFCLRGGSLWRKEINDI
ncbi:hypothetical protein EYF80_045691 [Liparis tanakae]|uniref:Uncharacterized protein n=1 Tax=Liparis tanakae TaxID=230148 RepID=A0A4Z2FTQ2_9TELE|nr:hypothetical protein EYF80_045691 [Liparis tanakae]